jgi:hypothetical protein
MMNVRETAATELGEPWERAVDAVDDLVVACRRLPYTDPGREAVGEALERLHAARRAWQRPQISAVCSTSGPFRRDSRRS